GYRLAHPARACCFSAADPGSTLITSAQTSFAALRAPAISPPAALLQMPSTLAFSAGERPGVAAIAARHDATARATADPLAPPAGVLAAGGVPPVPVLVEGVVAAGLAGGVELVWLLELDLPPPQPASNHPQASTAMRGTISRRNISSRSSWA